MSYGFQAVNGSNIVTVDENTRAYVYLGKYTVSSASSDQVTTINCVGVPLVFFSAPHGLTTGESSYRRHGTLIRGLKQVGSNQWQVRTFNSAPELGGSFALELRVFGRLDLNYSSGVPGSYGIRVWDSAGRLVFDSNGRMLRLAGNTYDTEIKLDFRRPGSTGGDPTLDYDDYDTAVPVAFSMSGKSILATTRGIRYGLQQTGSVWDPGVGMELFFGTRYTWAHGYWASGSMLYARNVLINEEPADYYGSWPSDGSLWQDAYTRLSVIDNAHFP